MIKTFYILVEPQTNRVRDLIEFPYGDYIPVELETPVPTEILRGVYKYINGSIQYVPEWDIPMKDLEDKISNLESQNLEKDERIQSLETLIFEII